MPFGSGMLHACFRDLCSKFEPRKWTSFVAAYNDLVFSVSLQEHLDHLHQIIHGLWEVGFKVNLASVSLLEEKGSTWSM